MVGNGVGDGASDVRVAAQNKGCDGPSVAAAVGVEGPVGEGVWLPRACLILRRTVLLPELQVALAAEGAV